MIIKDMDILTVITIMAGMDIADIAMAAMAIPTFKLQRNYHIIQMIPKILSKNHNPIL